MPSEKLNRPPLFERIRQLTGLVAINPRNRRALTALSNCYLDAGRPDKALVAAKKLLEAGRKNPQALKLIHDTSFTMNRLEDAKQALKQAMKLNLDKEPLLLDLARCYETEAQNDEAGRIYHKLIKQVPAQSAYRATVVARLAMFEVGPTAEFLYDEIISLLSREPIRSTRRAILHQAAAKIAEAQGRLDDAFRHYAAAGKSTAETLPREPLTEQTVARLQEIVTKELFTELGSSGSDSSRPIFVFGMQRSGTTLAEQILSCHPGINGAGELPFFGIMGNWFSPGQIDAQISTQISMDYLGLLNGYSNNADRIVDKMPDNFKHLWLMAAVFPNACFIHCRRDPLDTCISCFKRPISKAYRRDMKSIGKYYRNYSDLMAHWKNVLPVEIFDLNYEDLVSSPEHHIRKLIDHVGVEWDDACLRPHDMQRAVNTPSRNQVSKPINKDAIGSWRQYESHAGPLIEALGDLVK